ncbi:MAG: hypothetical protein GXX90_12375, partial [Microbacteriaceae bacterium]|nr:hypothetical protein [Microbacteriaceae bacterium]
AAVVAALDAQPLGRPASVEPPDATGTADPEASRTASDRRGPAAPDGAILVADGRPQWLAARILAAPLRRALAAARPGDSLRRILGPLALEAIEAPAELARDIDTLSDIAEAGVEPPPAAPQEGAAP